MFSVDEVMTTELVTLADTSTVGQAIFIMTDHHIRHLPVVNSKGEIKGLVSHRDLLIARDKLETPLSEIMTNHVTTIDRHARIRTAANYLVEHKIGCLPVTDEGKLVGIVTDTDFIGVAVNLIEQLEAIEPEEIY